MDMMLVHHRVTNSIKFNGTHLNTWVERGIIRDKCLAHEHNTMATWSEKLKSFEPSRFFRSFFQRLDHWKRKLSIE